jgi:hypothetical protein
MGKTLRERLNKLPARRRAKVEARTDELLAEDESLKDRSALLCSIIRRRLFGRSEVS